MTKVVTDRLQNTFCKLEERPRETEKGAEKGKQEISFLRE